MKKTMLLLFAFLQVTMVGCTNVSEDNKSKSCYASESDNKVGSYSETQNNYIQSQDNKLNYSFTYSYFDGNEIIDTTVLNTLNSEFNNLELEKNLDMWNSDNNSEYLDFEIVCKVYSADFDEDGESERYLYRYVSLPTATPDYCYRELWYENENHSHFIFSSFGRNAIAGIDEIENGPSVFYIVPEINMGALWQTAICYTATTGLPKVLFEDNTKEYFIFYYDNSRTPNLLFVNEKVDLSIIDELITNSDSENTPIQTLKWLNSELIVTHGVGQYDNYSIPLATTLSHITTTCETTVNDDSTTNLLPKETVAITTYSTSKVDIPSNSAAQTSSTQ